MILLALSLLNLFYLIYFYLGNGYLPEPFVHDKSDTFMDFFNPYYWSLRDGVYATWHSVYPPLNFLLLNLYGLLIIGPLPSFEDPKELQPLVGWQTLGIIFGYAVLVYLTVRNGFSRICNKNTVFIIFAIALLSPPSLFAIERGNLIFLSLYVFSIYVWSNTNFKKILAFAVLVNLKPYFLVIYFLELLRIRNTSSNNDFLILAPLVAVAIFLISGAIMDDEFYLLPFNLVGFASNMVVSPLEIFAFPTSVAAFQYLDLIFKNINLPSEILTLPKLLTYGLIFLIAKEFFQKEINQQLMYVFIVLFITNYSTSAGGYSALFYLPIIPILYLHKEYALLNLLIFTFFIGIWDWVILANFGVWNFHSYLSEGPIKAEVDFTLGAIIRPLGNFFALAIFYKNLRSKSDHALI